MTALPRPVVREKLLLGLAVMVGGLAAAGRSKQEIIGYAALQLARCGLLTSTDVRDLTRVVSRLAPSLDEAAEHAESHLEMLRSLGRAETQRSATRRAVSALETLALSLE